VTDESNQANDKSLTQSEYEQELRTANEMVYKHSLELARLKKALEIANRQQEGLLRFISHEVKGYLAKSEAAFAGITQGDYGAVTPPLETMAKTGLDDMRRGVDMVSDILDAANLRKGTVTYEEKPFDFKKSVEQVIDYSQEAAHLKGLRLEFTAEEGAYILTGDEAKMRRHVIRNLIDNAMRYTPSGSIHVHLSREGSIVRLSVKDSGVGITKEDMKNLFTEGGKGKDSTKVDVDSTGYGLFIAKQVADAHRGIIGVISDGDGKGSEFIVELPIT